jgi:hypothetical protein
MMRFLIATAAGILFAGGFDGGHLASGSDRRVPSNPVQRPPPPRITNLRVCAYEAFSLRLGRCVRDQRTTALTSSRFVCSVRVRVSRPASLRMQWTFEGAKLPPLFKLLSAGRTHTHWIKFDVGAGFPLPGGAYQCAFAVGQKRAAAKFLSGGPREDIVDAVVCDEANVFNYGGFPVCRTDQAGTLIRSPNAVICEAVYPKAIGHIGRITLLRGTEQLDDRRFEIREPMVQNYSRFQGFSNRPGQYTCRFSLDNDVVIDRQFEVS